VDRNGLRPLNFDGVAPYCVLHAQRRIARAHGVILVREGRAEERHDAVTHHLVDRALITVDGLHHPLENRIEDRARLLGVPIGQQLHRAFEVGEQDGYLLAFAFECGFRREDAFGKMLRRVSLR
jgi:hypothetical protein